MNEEFTPSAAPEVPPDPVPTQPPALELPPDYEPAAPPVEVISVEELLERLAQEGTEPETPPQADPNEALADIPVEPDPLMLILDQVIGKLIDVGIDLGNIEAHTRKIERHTDIIQEQITVVAQAVNHPALTTGLYRNRSPAPVPAAGGVPVRLRPYAERRLIMAEIIAEFFGVIGVDAVPPDNLAELIPYLLTVLIGVVLVSTVFRVIGRLAEAVIDFRRW